MRQECALAGCDSMLSKRIFILEASVSALAPMNPHAFDVPVRVRCSHRHIGRVFTIQGQTYKVCFDWGKDFELPAAHAPKAA
jgi:hypothetical protein